MVVREWSKGPEKAWSSRRTMDPRCIVTSVGSKAPFHQTHIPSVRCNPKTRGGKRMLSRGETRKDREVGSSPQTAIPREKGTESPLQEEAQPLHQAHSQGPSRLWR